MKRLFILLILIASPAYAQTDAQLSTLKAAIVADSALNAHANTSDGNFALAVCLNQLTTVACVSPGPGAGASVTVWKTRVQIDDIGNSFNAAELAGLSSLNSERLQTLAAFSGAGVNPSISNRRAFFDDIFSGSGGVNTRASLLTLWKRFATRVESILKAGGTGSDASPATLGFEGVISGQSVERARNLP